jgi:hypothetical protein
VATAQANRHAVVGRVLLFLGAVGVVTGAVPFTTNALRMLAREDLWNVTDLAAHGVEAMGLSVEWGMLSSAMGTFLGALLLAAGFGHLRGRPWARLVSWVYVAGGLTVNVTDMIIFAFRAKPGAMRSHMLVLDGIALLVPVALAAWLLWGRRSADVSPSASPPGRTTPPSA